jgi:S1-C subfamily serine protease
VLVKQVLPGSPAASAGVQVGDLIVTISGEPISDLMALRAVMGRYVAGDSVVLGILRGPGPLVNKALRLESGADQTPQISPFQMRQPPRPGPAPPPGTPRVP